jgi:hypothetical protein
MRRDVSEKHLLGIEDDKYERHDRYIAQQCCNRDPEVGITLIGFRVGRQWWQHPNKYRNHRDREAKRYSDRCPLRPLAAIAHKHPNSVAPNTSASASRRRASGRRLLPPRLSCGSKYRICHSNAPVTANSIAMTDWKY